MYELTNIKPSLIRSIITLYTNFHSLGFINSFTRVSLIIEFIFLKHFGLDFIPVIIIILDKTSYNMHIIFNFKNL